MKRIIVYILVLWGFYSNAQTNVSHPFPADSAVWYDSSLEIIAYDFPTYNIETNIKYYYNGFATVNGLLYNKVYGTSLRRCTGNCPGNFLTTINQDYFTNILLRIDSNKVYVINPYDPSTSDSLERLLYDYDIQVGDTFSSEISQISYTLVCFKIDSALTNSGYRKQWNFFDDCTYLSNPDTLKWIEGITSNAGLFYDKKYFYCSQSYVYYSANTQCFNYSNVFVLGGGSSSCEDLLSSVNDVTKSSKISIFPNPSTTGITVMHNYESKVINTKLYSITGSLLRSNAHLGDQFIIQRDYLPAGVYLLEVNAGNNLTYYKIVFTD